MAKIIKKQDKRREFVDALKELDNVVVLIPDVGFNYLDDPDLPFPVINTGVTEQATVMIAVGMAKEGYRPFVYSMINFVLFRPGEMVRNGLVGHDVPVTLVGVKGSAAYKFLGFSHNLLHEKEDFDFCDNIGLDWYNPEQEDVKDTVGDIYRKGKPAYLRL